jgi:flagellar operon protein
MAETHIYFQPQPLLPIGNSQQASSAVRNRATTAGAFSAELEQAQRRVSFSQHALSRMRERGIDLDDAALAKLDDTVDQMAKKGSRESLIYLNDVAMVVSVKNRTVITAMDGSSAKENIFTNIDSAAIL